MRLTPTSYFLSDEALNRYLTLVRTLQLNKARPKTRLAEEVVGRKIGELRASLKNLGYSTGCMKVSTKNYDLLIASEYSMSMPLRERAAEYKRVKEQAKEEIRRLRENNKRVEEEECEWNGIEYKRVGGVFSKANAILNMQTTDNHLSRITKSKQPSKNSPHFYIGVELELICKADRSTLHQMFASEFLGGNVYLKSDSSIRTENDSEYAHEVTIMARQTDYERVINKVCKVLNNPELHTYVNNSCGMHVHFDCRNRVAEAAFKNLVRVLPLASKMIPPNRINTDHARKYCRLNDSDIFNNETDSRYKAINAQAVSSHRTLEVRLHSGTTNALKINSWIKLFLNVIDKEHVPFVTTPEEYFSVVPLDSKLLEYMHKRITLFKEKGAAVDTRTDHFLFSEGEMHV